MAHKVSIIMPAYNEGLCIFDNIGTTHTTLKDAGFDAEIVAVDDGSPDNTLSEIERAAKAFDNVVPARNLYNMGKGMALRNGFEHSTGEIIVFLDADLDLHPSQITNLLSVLEEGPYDVVVTSKHHPESKLSYPFKRKVASLGYYMFIKLLFGLPVRDTQTGLKIFRRGVLEKVFHRLLVKTYAYDVELLATAVRFGYKIHEIPVVLDFKREMKWGRIKIGDVIKIFTDTLAIFYRLRVLRYYDVERPLSPDWMKKILIVFLDTLPSEGVIKGLTLNSHSVLAFMTEEKTYLPDGIISFRSEPELTDWLRIDENSDISAVGFLGSGYTPVGSWVKNAVRNFGNEKVMVVCGPVLPGKPDSFYGKVSSMLYSSAVTAGPFRRLFSVRRFKKALSGHYGNFFIRSSCIREGVAFGCMTLANGRIYYTKRDNSRMKYDPDIAVSKIVPPLFLPYLSMVASDFFNEGRYFCKPLLPGRMWPLLLTFIMSFLICGVFFVPHGIYILILSLYFIIILIPVLAYFDPVSVPFFITGAFLTHLAGAVFYPIGVLKGILDYFAGVGNNK